MSTIGSAFIRVRADTSQFGPDARSGVNQAGNEVEGAGASSGQRFSAGFGSVVKKLAGAAAIIGVSVGVGKTLSAGLARVTTIQDATTSLTTILGSQEKAAKFADSILKTVQGTPFNLDQFLTAGKNLAAFGVDASKVPGILTAIGDSAAASGKGADAVDSLVDTFGKMASTGKASMDSINTVAATGVPALKILANHYGKTAEEMAKMVSQGAVPAGDAIDALTKGIEEGSTGVAGSTVKFGGSMAALRETFNGALGGFRASIARLGAGIMGPLLDPMTHGLQIAADGVDKLTGIIKPAMTTAVTAVSSLYALLARGEVTDGLTKSLHIDPDGQFFKTLNSISDMIGVFRDRANEAGAAIAQRFSKIREAAAGVGRGLSASVSQMMPQIQDTLIRFGLGAAGAFYKVTGALGDLVKSAAPVAKSLFDTVGPILSQIGGALGDVFTAVGPVLTSLFATIGPILSQIGSVVGDLFAELGPSLIEILPLLNPFTLVLKSLLPVLPVLGDAVGKVAAAIGGALLTVIEALAPALPPIAAALGGVAAAIGGALANAVEALAPILPVLSDALATIAQTVAGVLASAIKTVAPLLPKLLDAFSKIATILVGALGKALAAVAPMLGTLAEMLVEVWAQVYEALLPVLPDLIDALLSIIDAVVPLIPLVVALFSDALKVAVPIVQALIPVLATVAGWLAGALATALSVAAGLVGAVATGIEWFLNAIKTAYDWVKDNWPLIQAILTAPIRLAVDLILGLWEGVKKAFEAVKDTVGRIASAMWAPVSAGLSWAWNEVISPIFEWVKSGISTVKTIIDPIISGISRAFEGIGNGLQWAWDHVISPVFNAIMNTISAILDGWDYIKSGGQSQGHLDSSLKNNGDGSFTIGGAGNNAKGTDYWRGGLTWVGEEGPELLNVPRGSQIIPNGESMDIRDSLQKQHYGTSLGTAAGTNSADMSGLYAQIAALAAAVADLASRPVVVEVDAREIARANATGALSLGRLG